MVLLRLPNVGGKEPDTGMFEIITSIRRDMAPKFCGKVPDAAPSNMKNFFKLVRDVSTAGNVPEDKLQFREHRAEG